VFIKTDNLFGELVMSIRTDAILKILNECPSDKMPVIFYGNIPKSLGNIPITNDREFIKNATDNLLIFNGYSATFVSQAKIDGNDRIFVLAHG
jgi:hypothetical protein